MAGYVSPDDILNGNTLSSEKTKKVIGYTSPDEIISNKPRPAQTQPTVKTEIPPVTTPYRFDPSDLAQTVNRITQVNPPTPSNYETRKDYPSRKIPIIGGVLSDLDKLSDTKLQHVIADIGKVLYTPGGSVANITGLSGAAESVIAKLFPSLITKTGGKIAQRVVSEAVTGAPLGVGQYQAQGGDNLKEAAISGLEGAALGGAFGAAIPLVKKGYQSAEQILKEMKAKPESVGPSYDGIGLDSNVGGKPNPVQKNPADYIKAFNESTAKGPIKPELIDANRETAPFSVSRDEFQKMADSDEYFIRTVRTPEKDLAGRTSTPAGKIGIELGLSNDTHKGLSGFNLKDQARMLEWMGKEGWEHENVAVYKGKPTKEQVTLDPGEVEFNPSELVGYVPTKIFKEHGGDFHGALSTYSGKSNGEGRLFPKTEENLLSTYSGKSNGEGRLFPKTEENLLSTYSGKSNGTRAAEKDTHVNIDTAPRPEPIKLTPAEQAKQARIDKFSQREIYVNAPDTSGHIESKTGRDKLSIAQKANETYIKTVDNLHRLNQFDQYVEGVLSGGKLETEDRTHTLGLNSRGADMVSRQILEKNMVDSKGTVLHQTDADGNVLLDKKGKPMQLSLKDVAKAIPKGKQNAFEDYLIAKHAITRMGRGESIYPAKMEMTIQKAEDIVKRYESDPRFVEAAAKYYDYNKKLGQAWLVDTGILPQEVWDGYLLNNPYYVPNNRIFSDLEKAQQFGSKRGFANQTNPVKPAPGSERPIVSPFESTIENTAKYVKTAKQNEVAQTLYRNLLKNPEEFEAWGKIVDDKAENDIAQTLNDEGIEAVLDDIGKGFEKRTDLTRGNVISALVDGKRVHMEINDPQLLEAMTNLSPPVQHFIMDNIGKITKTMKVLTTGLNPVFGLARNIWRDIPMSFVASKTSNNPLVIGKDLLESIISVASNGKLYNDFKNVGGGHSSSVAADRNLLKQSKEKILPSTSVKQALMRNLITKPFHGLENLNNAVETAPRLAEFKRLTKNGTYNEKVKGLYEANDITVNFSRFGNYTKQADSLFPYMNAAVQGLDKFARIYKDNPKQAIAKSIAVLTLPTIAMFLLNHDNPDYKQLSNFTKDNFIMIPKGDGTFFKVAKPRETGMIFSTAVERALREFMTNDPEAFKDFGTNFLNNFMPPAVSGVVKDGLPGLLSNTVAGPIQGLASNKTFMGTPIVSGDLEKLSPELQYDTKTSEPAKFLGGLINYSPKKIDFLIKSYAGIVGQLGIPLTTKNGSLSDTLKQQVTSDPIYSNDISRAFYDAMNKVDTAVADSKVTGNPVENDLSKFFNKITNTLAKIRKQMIMIQVDDTLSRKDRKSQLDELQIQKNEIQKSFLESIQGD